jgi:hypothetical protein
MAHGETNIKKKNNYKTLRTHNSQSVVHIKYTTKNGHSLRNIDIITQLITNVYRITSFAISNTSMFLVFHKMLHYFFNLQTAALLKVTHFSIGLQNRIRNEHKTIIPYWKWTTGVNISVVWISYVHQPTFKLKSKLLPLLPVHFSSSHTINNAKCYTLQDLWLCKQLCY